MKNACVKCGGTKIYDVEPRQTYCDAGGTLRDITLTGAEVATGERGMFGDKKELLMVSAEASVCAACGYAEWWVPRSALARLERLVGTPAVQVRQPPDPKTAFRG
jgi:hypothetical protein